MLQCQPRAAQGFEYSEALSLSENPKVSLIEKSTRLHMPAGRGAERRDVIKLLSCFCVGSPKLLSGLNLGVRPMRAGGACAHLRDRVCICTPFLGCPNFIQHGCKAQMVDSARATRNDPSKTLHRDKAHSVPSIPSTLPEASQDKVDSRRILTASGEL